MADKSQCIYSSSGVKVWKIPHDGLGTFRLEYSVQVDGQPIGKPYKSRAAAIRKAKAETPCPIGECEHFVVIIRCVWTRGETQREALAELKRRGLWLSDEQKIAAGSGV